MRLRTHSKELHTQAEQFQSQVELERRQRASEVLAGEALVSAANEKTDIAYSRTKSLEEALAKVNRGVIPTDAAREAAEQNARDARPVMEKRSSSRRRPPPTRLLLSMHVRWRASEAD